MASANELMREQLDPEVASSHQRGRITVRSLEDPHLMSLSA